MSLRIVGLEEHFATPEIVKAWESLDPRWQDLAVKASSAGEGGRRLLDFGEERLAAMDAAGVDVQVLSLTTPGVQGLAADDAVALAKACNDGVAEVVRARPERFQAFATLPTPVPREAARELERCVCRLGLQGALLCGRTGEKNLDHPDFWPIFEVAAALKAPLYLHPQTPQNGVVDAYYTGYGEELDSLFARAGMGWHYETGVQMVRLILSGIFDRFPDLQIITGHMGEMMLFYLDRIELMRAAAKLPRKISEYVRDQVYVTPSGLFSQRYLRWAIEVIGAERMMMATDYPFAKASQNAARNFLMQAELSEEERQAIGSGNWERLCARIER